MIPGQQIAGERQAQSQQQQQHADHPVELARLLVRAGVEHPAHMQKDADHHAVRRPAMHVAQERPHEDDKLKILHVLVSLRRVGTVIAHQRYPGGHQDEKEKEGDEAQVKRVPELQILFLHLGRMDMQPHVEKDQFGLSLVGGERIPPHDRLPDFANQIHRYTINR